MKPRSTLFFAIAFAVETVAQAQNRKRDIPYAEPANERLMLDVNASVNAIVHTVIFWIHGGCLQTGDKTRV